MIRASVATHGHRHPRAVAGPSGAAETCVGSAALGQHRTSKPISQISDTVTIRHCACLSVQIRIFRTFLACSSLRRSCVLARRPQASGDARPTRTGRPQPRIAELGCQTSLVFAFVQQSKTKNEPAKRFSLLASGQGLTAISERDAVHFSVPIPATRRVLGGRV
jgi:hypothetical protein